MHRTEGIDGLDYWKDPGVIAFAVSDEEKDHYSTELQELILDCMKLHQSERRSFSEILKRIRRCKDPRKGGELRNEPPQSENWNNYYDLGGNLRDSVGFLAQSS